MDEETIICKGCGTKYEADRCSIFCLKCNVSICPDCGYELDGERMGYCGNNCYHCDWQHCGSCE